jgi:hypothetical protein
MPRVYSLIAKPVKSNIRSREYSLTDVNMGLMPQPPIQGLPSRRMKSPVRPTPLTPQNVNLRQRSQQRQDTGRRRYPELASSQRRAILRAPGRLSFSYLNAVALATAAKMIETMTSVAVVRLADDCSA